MDDAERDFIYGAFTAQRFLLEAFIAQGAMGATDPLSNVREYARETMRQFEDFKPGNADGLAGDEVQRTIQNGLHHLEQIFYGAESRVRDATGQPRSGLPAPPE